MRVVYYESMKRNLKIKPVYECRYDGRLHWVCVFIYYESMKRKLKPSVTLVVYYESSIVVYYESLKRELKTKTIYRCRYDERLKN